MTENQFIKNLRKRRGFFKKVTYDRGIMGLIFNNYNLFMKTSDHLITRQVRLGKQNSTIEEKRQVFDMYAIFAAPLNADGENEIEHIERQMNSVGLLCNIPQIRIESRAISFFRVDPNNNEEFSGSIIRGYSTENLLIYALTVNDEKKYGPLDSFDFVLISHDNFGYRYALPFQGKKYL